MPSSSQPPLAIGARGSKLALAQARTVQAVIAAALGAAPADADRVAPIVVITTTGDRVQDRRLLEIGGKGLFTQEIEAALADGRIACAVHSLKDMPSAQPPGLVIGAIPSREDPRDVFVSRLATSVDGLPRGARLGTASLRRQAQALHRRPDLAIVNLRGNVDTRLAKLGAGEADAIVQALAGHHRLGLTGFPATPVDLVDYPPAPGQGALAIEVREADAGAPWLEALRHAPTTIAVAAERGALAALDGSCRTAIGAYASLSDARLSLVVEALTPDGARRFREVGETDVGDAAEGGAQAEAAARALGERLGEAVRTAGGAALMLDGSRGR